MKRIFNFYLDDEVKMKVGMKITRLAGEENKGQVASLIRVMLNRFVNTPDNEVDKTLLEEMKREYVLTTNKNKRSRM